MTADQLRQKYFDFFVSKGHKITPSASLVPVNDPTVLFTTAGMHPLVPYLLGQTHPLGKRLVGVQKCLRTGDIDEVGDSIHHTFFEMLGNWSLGDYFKKEAIEWSYEFLTKEINLDPQRIFVTCFLGDKDAPKDDYSANVWNSLGIPKERILFFNKKENWWGPAGQTGPCGPDSEMHYDLTQKSCGTTCGPNTCNCGRFSEIWNNVFMEYNKTKDGKFIALTQQNVDTGMGLERILAIINGHNDNYKTPLWTPVIKILELKSNKKYNQDPRPFRIIADHIRSAVFIISDGVQPGNKEQGYILRRLIRRSIIQLKQLGILDYFPAIKEISSTFINIMSSFYKELKDNQDLVNQTLKEEVNRFEKTLNNGLREFNKLEKINGKTAFNLFQTYGFPFEITEELAKEKGLSVNKKTFKKEFLKHQEKSRTASAGMFKGGLADHSETTTRYHTTTHLLHQAMRDVLGNHIEQAGSNITVERLRFDFTHKEALTEKEIAKIEEIINQKIEEDLPVTHKEMPYQEAIDSGVLAFFKQKYPEQVTAYSIGKYSKELCGGPHVTTTGKIGKIKVDKQKALGQGLRRVYLKFV